MTELVPPLTLSQLNLNSNNLVFYVVIFMMFGMPVLRALFGQKTQKKKPGRSRPGGQPRPRQGSAPPRPGGVSGRPGAQSSASVGGGMTMAERIARARQAQQGGGGASAPPPASPSVGPAASTARGPSAHAQAQAQADAAARARRAAQDRQRQEHEAQARRRMEHVREQQRRQRELADQQQQRQEAQRQAQQQQAQRATHRLVADVVNGEALTVGEIGGAGGGNSATPGRRAGALALLNGGNLREAYILKEVLDRPLALRDAPGR